MATGRLVIPKKIMRDKNEKFEEEMELFEDESFYPTVNLQEIMSDNSLIWFISAPIFTLILMIVLNVLSIYHISPGEIVFLMIFFCLILYMIYQIYLEQEVIILDKEMNQLPERIRGNSACGLDGMCKIKRRNLIGKL